MPTGKMIATGINYQAAITHYMPQIERAFNHFKNLEIEECNIRNGKIVAKKLGSDDNAVEAEEYKYALKDLYNTWCEKKSDKVYTEWMRQCGTINEPIKDAKTFGEMVIKAFEQLIKVEKAVLHPTK